MNNVNIWHISTFLIRARICRLTFTVLAEILLVLIGINSILFETHHNHVHAIYKYIAKIAFMLRGKCQIHKDKMISSEPVILQNLSI